MWAPLQPYIIQLLLHPPQTRLDRSLPFFQLPTTSLHPPAMSIQGQLLELRVTGCTRLRDTEFFSRQDPYVIIEYANNKFRTRTCTDGGRNPSFDDKFHIPLIEGLRELNVTVWNSNTLSNDDFIGNGRVQLHKVLTSGFDDSSWPLQTRHMRSAGELKIIMHFDVSGMKNKMGKNSAPSSSYTVPAVPPYQTYPAPSHVPYSAPAAPPSQQPCPHHAYPPAAYPQQPYGQPYPPQPYGQQPYPPQPYGQQPYPPQPYGQPYPPPSGAPSPYPPAPYPGAYPPPPY